MTSYVAATAVGSPFADVPTRGEAAQPAPSDRTRAQPPASRRRRIRITKSPFFAAPSRAHASQKPGGGGDIVPEDWPESAFEVERRGIRT
jgi:hypothetical protein